MLWGGSIAYISYVEYIHIERIYIFHAFTYMYIFTYLYLYIRNNLQMTLNWEQSCEVMLQKTLRWDC